MCKSAWWGCGAVGADRGTHQALPSCSDPDNVAFCVLAADQEDEGDIALQIHFTLIQAFCCENDIDIVRVNDVAKLAAIVGPSEDSGEPRDLHCILITVGVPRAVNAVSPALPALPRAAKASRGGPFSRCGWSSSLLGSDRVLGTQQVC